MEELPPILDYIRKSEEAEKQAQGAVQPSAAAPATGSDLTPLDDVGDRAVEDASPIVSGFKAVDFQKRESTTVGTASVLRAVQAMHDPGEGMKKPPVCYCGAPRLADVDVHLREDESGRRKAGVSGVWRCRAGEICPMCAEAATAKRRASYARVGDAITLKGGRIVTLVLSVSHGLQHRLADLMRAVKKASTDARAGNPWHRKIKAALGAIGVLVDHHVRYGERYGWHYHQHLTIFCLSDDEPAISEAIAALIQRYVRLLTRQGFRADVERQHSKILNDGPEAGPYTYPADHNRGGDEGSMEIAAADHDEDESLSPLMLAERAALGDEKAKALFMEFSSAIKGTRSVVVTPAMARALKIERKEDEAPAYTDETRLGSIPGKVWTKLLNENLAATFLTRVESAGRPNWPAVRWWALEQTGEVPEYSIELANEVAELTHARQRLADPTAKELGRDQIEILCADWTAAHGADLVAATMDYVAAHHRHMAVDTAGVEYWVAALEDLAGKVDRRRAHSSRMILPVRDDRLRETVPIG